MSTSTSRGPRSRSTSSRRRESVAITAGCSSAIRTASSSAPTRSRRRTRSPTCGSTISTSRSGRRCPPEASAQLRMGNYERLFDAARRKVRAWEAANVATERDHHPGGEDDEQTRDLGFEVVGGSVDGCRRRVGFQLGRTRQAARREAVAMLRLPSHCRQLVDEAHAQLRRREGRQERRLHPDPRRRSRPSSSAWRSRPATARSTRAGDVDYRFSIQSVSKPFTAALVMQQYGGPEIIAEKIGVEPTGLPFNSKLALEIYKAPSVNPLVNAGAIAAVSLVKAKNENERWQKVLTNLEGLRRRRRICRSSRRSTTPSTRRSWATAASRTCSSTTSGSTPSPKRRCASTPRSARSASTPRTWR